MENIKNNITKIFELKITIDNVNERLDKFLAGFDFKKEEKIFEFSRGDFIRAIKNGNILVNDSSVKPSYKLQDNDLIRIDFSKFIDKNELVSNSKIKLNVIFQDTNIIVINKQAGLQIHPDYNEKRITVVNALVHKFPELLKMQTAQLLTDEQQKIRPGIVHRLDKYTSGILVIARNKKSFLELKKIFQERKIQKKYLAVVYGVPEEIEGTIDKPLARSSNYRRQTIAGRKTKTKIREALTEYRIIKTSRNKKYSLLELTPHTGRTHQIRVHLFSIGHPIVGDEIYRNKKYKLIDDLKRHLLHAHSLEFKLFSKDYKFTSPTPTIFEQFVL